MMRFGRNSGVRKVRYRKRKAQKCHLRFCGTVNKRRVLLPKRGALQVVKTKTCLWYFCGQTRNRRGFYHGDFHFGGPNRDRTDDLTDANEPTGIVCTWIWPFLAVSANNHFVFKPLVTTIFRVFREPLWYVLWSASEPRWNAPARLVCCLRVDDTSERGVRQQFSAHSNARGAMLNQGIGRVLPCCGSSRKINSGNKIENLKTGRIIDKLALLC